MNNRSIAPAILAQTLEEYNEQMNRISEFAERIHIDITDGSFAPSPSVLASELWWPEDKVIDIHAMVWKPEDYLVDLINLKPDLVIFHAECNGDLPAVFATLKQYEIRCGLAILRSTVPSTIKNLIELADHLMIFSGNLGQYGGTAHLMQLEKVRMLKNINPVAEISWDGGVNADNAYTLVQGGVNVLNVGGFIHNSDNPKTNYDMLVTEINKQGVI